MGHFLYFLPSESVAYDPKTLPVSLADTLAGVLPQVHPTKCGPNGQPGFVLQLPTELGPRYNPEQQKWEKQVRENYWVGYDLKDLPTEIDLRRNELIPGYQISLKEEAWNIPSVRLFLEGEFEVVLPCTMICNDEGKWSRGPIQQQYLSLLELVEPYFNSWSGAFEAYLQGTEEKIQFSIDDMIGMAVSILKYNYRIGLREASMLGLFSGSQEAAAIANYCCDCYTALKWSLKKTKSDTDG